MSLTELIAGVKAHRKTLTAVNAAPHVVESLRERFDDRNVAVRAVEASDVPDDFVILSEDGRFVAAAGVAEVVGDDPDRGDAPGAEDTPYRPILDHLDETMFTSYDPAQMVAASREIEDRAWRAGAGTLYAGFQKLSVLADQAEMYDRLAARGDLSVHAYAYPDADPPEHEEFTVHIERTDEIRDSWFVVYDGDGAEENKCALLAEERDARSFYGFWTYDADTVDWIVEHLTSTYGLVGRP